MTDDRICVRTGCSRPVTGGRSALYCGPGCKQRAYEERRALRTPGNLALPRDQDDDDSVPVDEALLVALRDTVDDLTGRVESARQRGAEPNWPLYFRTVTDAATAVIDGAELPPRGK